jgi:hypothetical protein
MHVMNGWPRLASSRRARIAVALTVAAALPACHDPGPGVAASSSSGTSAPALFIADQFTGTQRATQAVVDAGTIWLLDANGDFVFGADPSKNWNAQTGLALSWAQIPGAAKYHVKGRNTVTAPTTWTELLAIPAPDLLLNPTVVATGVNPWSTNLGTNGFPWSFGNHVQLAISAEDADGTAIGKLSEPLDLADGFPGLLTGVEIDHAGLPAPFTPQVELGATFDKTIRLSFSEPMLTSAPPTVTSRSANVTVRRVDATAWGSDPAMPSAAPPSAAAHAFLALELTVKGACTEVLVPRTTGDGILVVRDTSFFSPGTSTGLLFLDGATGALLGETADVVSMDANLGRIVLGKTLPMDLPAGALACALSGPGATVARLVSTAGSSAAVGDASPFFVGEPVAVYEPQSGAGGGILDVRTVTGVDTVGNELLLSAALTPGHGPASVVLPLNGLGGEVALRPSTALTLQRDVAGGPLTELFVTAPTSLMVGDTVLVDADGDLQTTPDQAQTTVKQVKFAPAPGSSTYSIVLDLPASMILLHGRATVIGLGDSFLVGGTRDTTASETTPLDVHADQFSPDGLLF